MGSPRSARRRVLEFALSLPGAWEDHPWGEDVAKVGKKVFVFLGIADGSYPLAMTVKLEDSHAQALAVPGAEPTGYGLGKAGWVSVAISGKGAPPAGLLEDWIEESYRTIASKRLVAELDARA